MKEDGEYTKFFLKNLQPKATKEEIDEILAQNKLSFRSKKRLTRMLLSEIQSVHEETEQISKKVLGLILDKEEQPVKLKSKDLPEWVKLIDCAPDKMISYMINRLMHKLRQLAFLMMASVIKLTVLLII